MREDDSERTTFRISRRRAGATNGSQPDGMRTRPVAVEAVDEPIDLVAVQADDELISALAAGTPVTLPGFGGYDADDRIAAILATWKAEVDAEPIPELVDLDTAVAAVLAGRRPSRRARHLAPLAAAAAFIVFAVGSVSIGAQDARPGDTLWSASKVLYPDRAESVEAAVRVEVRIAAAKRALVRGETGKAAEELDRAEADLADVRPEEGHRELAEVQDFLAAKVDETRPGTPTDPGAPLTKQPARPVPSGAVVTPDEQPGPVPTGVPGTSTSAPGTGGPSSPPTSTGPTAPPSSGVAPTGSPSGSAQPTTGPTATAEGLPDGTAVPPSGHGLGPATGPDRSRATAAGSGGGSVPA